MRSAVRDLRSRRRAQRLAHLDWVDALYRAYVVGISGVAALIGFAVVVGDAPVAATTVRSVGTHGAAVVGAFIAFLVAIGLRSGAHGGPLAFEAADVQHVMLAPVERGPVVRAAAYKQLRGVVTSGVLAGAVLGIVAAPKLPGPDRPTATWVMSGIAFGLLAALAAWGSALLGSALRITQRTALVVGAALLAWSAIDIVETTQTSPLTWTGHVAVWPVRSSWWALLGVAVVGGLIAVGLSRAARLSLEHVQDRARLVSALRFAATIQDLRAVITLRRQLTHEQSRSRPWIRVPAGAVLGRAAWRRDWHGIARWPGARLTRVFILTLVAGASCAAAVRGTTVLFAVAAIAAYVIALDAVEGLAQEIDHPDRAVGVPQPSGDVYFGHLATPAAMQTVLAVLGFGSGLAVGSVIHRAAHVHAVAPVVGLAVIVALVAVAPAAAALSVYLGRPDRDMSVAMLHPGVVAAQQAGPLVLVALAFLPLIVAREVDPPTDPIRAGFAAAAPALMIAFGIVTFLRGRAAEAG